MTESLRQTILELLAASDTYLSGQELSDKLGVSRTSIWKHITALKELGYIIDSVPNQGYRLLGIPSKFIPEEILRRLQTTLFGRKIVFSAEVDSTNTQAKNYATEYPEGTIFLAETQHGGRGRMGRQWNSEPGKGIWCSVLLKPTIRPSVAGLFPLITAVALAEALRATGVEAKIKWPNDLLVGGKKVCGILTEMAAEIDRINYLVIGFGINVKHRAGDFPSEIQPIATSLEMALGKEVDRVELLCAILYQLEQRYHQFLVEGFESIRELWKTYTCTLGSQIKVSRWNQPPLLGTALDITGEGALLLQLEDGQVVSLNSGEIIHQSNDTPHGESCEIPER